MQIAEVPEVGITVYTDVCSYKESYLENEESRPLDERVSSDEED